MKTNGIPMSAVLMTGACASLCEGTREAGNNLFLGVAVMSLATLFLAVGEARTA